MTQQELDIQGFFQQAETHIYDVPYIYLASPFSHPDPQVRKARVAAIAKITARLIAEGHIVFSPVAAYAEIQKDGDPPAGWYHFTLRQLAACTHLRVVKMDGWQESEGIKKEIAFAMGRGMPIEYMEVPRENIIERRGIE